MTSGEDDVGKSVDRIEQLPVSDWTDQDLLTKDEARGRLVDEIGRCRARLDQLKANNADEGTPWRPNDGRGPDAAYAGMGQHGGIDDLQKSLGDLFTS